MFNCFFSLNGVRAPRGHQLFCRVHSRIPALGRYRHLERAPWVLDVNAQVWWRWVCSSECLTLYDKSLQGSHSLVKSGLLFPPSIIMKRFHSFLNSYDKERITYISLFSGSLFSKPKFRFHWVLRSGLKTMTGVFLLIFEKPILIQS